MINPQISRIAGCIAWDELITDLHRARMRATEIAERVGVGRTTIVAYREDGHTPLHPTGERLIELWVEVTRKPRANLPRVGETRNVNVLTG